MKWPTTPRSGLCTWARASRGSDTMSMLELRGIRAGYGRLPVLFDVDLTVEAGEWVGIVGANGAGRSTLMKTILGSGSNVTAGEVFFGGQRVTHLSAHKRVAAGISMSPEGRR